MTGQFQASSSHRQSRPSPRHRDEKRMVSSFDINVIFLPFSSDNFQIKTKPDKKKTLKPTKNTNMGRVGIFPNIDVLKVST